MAEKESEHSQNVETMKAREIELINKIEDLSQQLEVNGRELEKNKSLQQDYRNLLNDILVKKKRNSTMSQSSVDSFRSASAIVTGTSRTELTSDYGDHDTLDKELAQAYQDDDEEPDHSQLISELKRMKDESRLSVVDAMEQSKAVKDLRQELEEVRTAYEEETTELQKTLAEVKSQLLSFTRQRSLSNSSSSDVDGEKTDEQSPLGKIKNLQRQISQQREDHKEVIQLMETAQTLAAERERKNNELAAALELVKKDFDQQTATVAKLTSEIDELKAQNAQTLKDLEKSEQSAKEFEKRSVEIGQALESLISERDASVRDLSELRTKLEKVTKDHGAMVKDMEASHKETVQNLKKDNSEYLTIIQHLKDQVSESETSMSTHLLQLTSLQQKLDAATKESDKAKRAKNAVDRDLKELKNEVSVITRQRQESREKLTEVTELLEQLQKDYDSLKGWKARVPPSDGDPIVKEQAELIHALETRLAELETRPTSGDPQKRLRSNSGRWSNGTPTPPPGIPLPPLPSQIPVPTAPVSPTFPAGRTTPTSRLGRSSSQDQLSRINSRDQLRSPEPDNAAYIHQIEEKDQKIASLEKQFQSERQLVQTLEEALSDTEKSLNKLKKQTNSLAAEKEVLHTKMLEATHQLEIAKREAAKSRDSIQQLDEARAQRAKVFLPLYVCSTLLIIVGGSSAQTIGGANGRNQQSKKIKILVLLKIQSFHYFYFYIVIALFYSVFLALGGKRLFGEKTYYGRTSF